MQKCYILFWPESQKYTDNIDCLPIADGEGIAVPCELIDGE